MLLSLALYLAGFLGMWLGAGLAVSPISKLAKSLHLSAFNVSFIILGIATSISELSVGLNAISTRDPEIFVGNLIGASLVLFLLIIPLLALMGHRINIDRELRGANLALVVGTVGLPALLSFDGVITNTDAGVALVAYAFLLLIVQQKQDIIEKLHASRIGKSSFFKLVASIIIGICIIFFSAKLVVTETIYFAGILKLSPFLLSLLLISLGTNLPEVAVGIRSLFGRQKNLAFGDYVGSAAFNCFLFGLLSFLHQGRIILTNSYWIPLLTTLLGLSLFYLFAKSKNTLSRREALALLLLYIGFLTAEVLK